MRLEIPDEIPRRRIPEGRRPSPPLEPSPIEIHRERLAELAANRRVLNLPRPPRDREHMPEPAGNEPERGRSHRQERPIERRERRNEIPQQEIGLSLRPEEVRSLADIGRLRVVATRDLAERVYGGERSRLQRDLRFLEQRGLVEVDTVNGRRDGRGGRVERIEVVTLTAEGRRVALQTSGLPHDQKLYAGLVKPREVEHDAQIYRAWQKEVERIEMKGGRNARVKLDFELKSEIQKAIHAARHAEPARDMSEIKQEVAQRFELPYVNDGIQIPDARIEYDLAQGGSGHEDIEVLTAAYRPGHLRAKAQAGFHVYASAADRATLTAKIEDDHYLMESILEL
jgi:hypothetical protein